MLCNVEYIEFEGRSDGESVKKLIAQMKPKQLILVHGSAQATRHLAQHCYDNNIAQVSSLLSLDYGLSIILASEVRPFML